MSQFCSASKYCAFKDLISRNEISVIEIKLIEEEALWPKVSVIPRTDGSLISMPIEDFPSMTSTTLTLLTASYLAKSFAIFDTWLAFVPGARFISNLVITGPGNESSALPSIPNSSNLFTKFSAKFSR